MATPNTLDEYNAKVLANIKYEGYNFDLVTVFLCMGCAEPDFLRIPVIDYYYEAWARGAVCEHCGRGFRGIVTRNDGSVRLEIVQTRGDPLPSYLPEMRREENDDAST